MWIVTGAVWRYPGPGAWHFFTMPTEVADEVRARAVAKPFGSVRVRATVGATTWDSSLFADTKSESYLLPVKADVRRRAGIEAGETVTLTIVLTESAA